MMPAPSSGKVSKYLTHLLAIFLVIMMAQSLAQLTWLPFRDWQPALSGAAAMQSPEQRQADRIPALVTGNLFGRQESLAAQSEVLSQVEAPKTRLQLILEGVFLADKEEDSGAIVSERGQSAQRYRIGEKLPGNAELVGVFPDRIVLRRAGQLEALSFEDAAAAMLEKVERPQISSPEDFVGVAQQQLMENPVAALTSVGLAPADSGGQPQGYVYTGDNPMLRALNLQQGDIIRSVNGHVLGDMQKDREMLKELSQQAMLEVEVERGGMSFTVSYPLR